MITPAQKKLIERIVNVFETGKSDGVYDALVVLPNGRNNSRQITYGRSQTTEQGNLKKLIEMYIANHGRFASDFELYIWERSGSCPWWTTRSSRGCSRPVPARTP